MKKKVINKTRENPGRGKPGKKKPAMKGKKSGFVSKATMAVDEKKVDMNAYNRADASLKKLTNGKGVPRSKFGYKKKGK